MTLRHTDIMLDLETLGTGNDAAIASIGAVAFDADEAREFLYATPAYIEQHAGKGFYRNIDLSSSVESLRGDIDPATVEWWMQQGDDARRSLYLGKRVPLGQALIEFGQWVEEVSMDTRTLWSNGPTFDEVIIRSAARRYDFLLPFHFSRSRCCRTMMDLAKQMGFRPAGPGKDIVKHNALHDAVNQARGVVAQRQFIRGRIFDGSQF